MGFLSGRVRASFDVTCHALLKPNSSSSDFSINLMISLMTRSILNLSSSFEEDYTPITVSKEDQDGSTSVKKIEFKCSAEVVQVSPRQFSISFTFPLLDLRTNPFQEEGNDEDKVKIDRIVEEIIKLMEKSEDKELGFNKA